MKKMCLIEGCNRPHHGRGYCRSHYGRVVRSERVDTPLVQLKHWLHNLDPVARTAICTECGPVSIRQRGEGRWRCAKSDQHIPRLPGGMGYRRHKGSVCERCGFVPADPCQLDVHHIDHNHQNNSIENLETLCANCHRLEHFSQQRLRAA